MKILVKTLLGLEDVLAEEIASIGGENIKILNRAVQYEGDRACLYKSNIMLRTALRVLVVKKEFNVRNENQLYDFIKNIPWEGIMNLDDTFAIDATSSGETFTHSKYIALKSKDAIADRFVDKFGKRPNVNVLSPTYRLNIHIRGQRATLSLDSSAESLHMRGYRMNTVDAPMNEVLAAGILKLMKWDGSTPLMDPMCGSGTLLIEAASIASNMPPQRKNRAFGFKKWKSYDASLYNNVYDECLRNRNPQSYKIYGQDKSLRSVKVTQQNLIEAGLDDKISVIKKDFFKTHPPKNLTVVTNPPYDERLKESDIDRFYENIGEKFYSDFKGVTPWVFSANLDAMRTIRLKVDEEYELMNGGLPAKLVKFKP